MAATFAKTRANYCVVKKSIFVSALPLIKDKWRNLRELLHVVYYYIRLAIYDTTWYDPSDHIPYIM